jgi:hypothetical protein
MKPFLDEYEYDALKMEIGKMHHRDIENLFEFCYTVDRNDASEEQKYRLKPQKDIIKQLGYNKKTDMSKWKDVEQGLIEAMQHAADSLYYYKEFNERQRNSFFLSGTHVALFKVEVLLFFLCEFRSKVTQQEIYRGVLAQEKEVINDAVVIVYRNIHDLWQQTTSDVNKYKDDYDGAEFFLEKLKKRVDKRVPTGNKHFLEVGAFNRSINILQFFQPNIHFVLEI